ncbi:hypothetical protein DL766_010180 [Monosporascus sp. MC13-8B]|uniref:Uncharacterized protein n=1 Tax=Monosporascus cannonballus TaxID=155416 RepID=A0ABY0HNU4_9PEZI|nr:hypothetical protein DL762_000111 [Monosporascus cannonballus]RYO97425.1 hypothetical protein DL763_002774 [Monosporascus cannonballus]RYP08566.1 hypothetical protein DL766_010180 [Monosporascus sp. MC13-8B]
MLQQASAPVKAQGATIVCNGEVVEWLTLQADIAGPGAIVAFTMEAALVTTYILLLRVPFFNSSPRVSSVRRRFLDAARGSLHDMFLAAVVLAAGVLIAAALGRSQKLSDPATADDPAVEAGSTVLLLVTTFCINPVLLLYALLGCGGYRRRWLARGITFVSWIAWVLSQTLRIFSSRAWRDGLGFAPGSTIGELIQWDDRNHKYPGCTYGLQEGRGSPILLWICFWVTLILPALYSVRPRWRLFERIVSGATMFFSFVGMWDALGILLYIHVQTLGTSWDLGQILALGTWIPVLFEFIYIFILGIPSILEIRVPQNQIQS